MELWLVYSFIALLGYFFVALFLKFTAAENPFLISLILYGAAVVSMVLFIFFRKEPLTVAPNSIIFASLAGIASVTGTIFALKALNIAPNPGYVVTIYSSAFFLFALVSFIFFHAPFTMQKFLGVVAVLVGLILISI